MILLPKAIEYIAAIMIPTINPPMCATLLVPESEKPINNEYIVIKPSLLRKVDPFLSLFLLTRVIAKRQPMIPNTAPLAPTEYLTVPTQIS